MIDLPEVQEATLTTDSSKFLGLLQRLGAYARRNPLAVNALLFVGGFYIMPNGWMQLCCFLGLLMLQALQRKVPDITLALRRDHWVRAVFVYLVLGLVGSLIVNPLDATNLAVVRWGGGAALLGLFLLVMWQVGLDGQAVRFMGATVAGVGALTAVGSIVMLYILSPDGLIGDRLRNWFVYGGLHPVCAGLMWGFAATWVACRWNDSEGPERRWWLSALVVLLGASMLTLSRGTLLSLGAGHAALFLVRGWRKAWRPCALLAGIVVAFQLSAPLMTQLADFQEKLKTGVLVGRDHTREELGEVVVTHNPMRELCARGDNGRLELYKHVFGAMNTSRDVWFGKGVWAPDWPWRRGMSWAAEHMHSIYVSTLYHHGVAGLLALFLLLGWGMRRCFAAAREGEDLWLVLACYGAVALTFDGHSMQTLISVPRFESLLLWLPLVMGCAAGARRTVS